MKMRGGSVLGKKTILKSDHFPGCQNKRLSPQIDGAPNYRQVLSLYRDLFCCILALVFIFGLQDLMISTYCLKQDTMEN